MTHVDDFTVAGAKDYVMKILDGVVAQITISKVEQNSFRYTCLGVKALKDSIEVAMQQY